MRILGISGSLRRDSHNLRLLRAAAAELPPEASFEWWDELAQVPPYNEDEDTAVPRHAAVRDLRAALLGADAVVISTPEYNGSVPGQLKNALDWASRPYPANALRGKPVVVLGASTGLFGAVWAQAEVRKVLDRSGAHVVDEELPVGQAADAFNEAGKLRDPDLQVALGELMQALVREIDSPIERVNAA